MTKPGCYLATALPFLVARESGCHPSAGRKGELWPMKSVTSAYSLASWAAGRLSGAARRTFSSLPAVSRRLAALEERFGVRLIDRGPPRFTFTDEGALFRERAVANWCVRSITLKPRRAPKLSSLAGMCASARTRRSVAAELRRTSTLDPRAAGAEGPGGFALGRRALSCAATSASTLPTLCGKMLAQRRRYDLGEAEIHRLAVLIDDPIEKIPFAPNIDIGLINSPGSIHGSREAVPSLLVKCSRSKNAEFQLAQQFHHGFFATTFPFSHT